MEKMPKPDTHQIASQSIKKVTSITIENNEAMRRHNNEKDGWYLIDDVFPQKPPDVTKPPAFIRISSPDSKLYPDHGAFGILLNLEEEGDHLRCFVWTMGNTQLVDRNTFEWFCHVNRCLCFNKNIYRILNKHYQQLELLYLQYGSGQGNAFRSIRFLSLPTTLDTVYLRELHLHATSCSLFGHFYSISSKDKMIYGVPEDTSQYLAQAVSHMQALEIIVLKNDDVDYPSLLLYEKSAYSSVYMTINDDVLPSLASHCARLKEIVIWGPHMEITGLGVVEISSSMVANQDSLTSLEVDCLLSDEQRTSLLQSSSLKNLKSLKSKDRPSLYPSNCIIC
ncbi:hypothetical protein BDA99DRAFT_576192 [Phascolomyces articulosus]|uniref:Uncharacterized protein n=1 Tax=Phascolomyces articulosus TaxID=60185 RepID=A0AAD5P8H0_9FUNG|nr:hypothetical protein BDA99DRAFT_576192 [Phascolomyces articulosus]